MNIKPVCPSVGFASGYHLTGIGDLFAALDDIVDSLLKTLRDFLKKSKVGGEF